MKTDVLVVHPANPDPAAVARAAAVIRAGGLVAFPTETVYGLGANALDPDAVGRIFSAKGRPATNPVIVHVADPADVLNVASAWPATAAALAGRFWPGPLTLVLPKRATVPDVVTAGGPTVAVRCPSHPVARALIAAAGVPIAAPSANRSTEVSPTTADHVLKGLAGRINLVLDGGRCEGGIESTVVDLTSDRVVLLRPGLVTGPMLEAVIGALTTPDHRAEEAVARSPGQMARHYCPRTPLSVAANLNLACSLQHELSGIGLRVLVVSLGRETAVGTSGTTWSLPSDPIGYAAELYTVLHLIDDRWEFDRVIVEMPPEETAWAGIRDRLRRAADDSIRPTTPARDPIQTE